VGIRVLPTSCGGRYSLGDAGAAGAKPRISRELLIFAMSRYRAWHAKWLPIHRFHFASWPGVPTLRCKNGLFCVPAIRANAGNYGASALRPRAQWIEFTAIVAHYMHHPVDEDCLPRAELGASWHAFLCDEVCKADRIGWPRLRGAWKVSHFHNTILDPKADEIDPLKMKLDVRKGKE
jgi:hypothetical protein